MDANMIEGAAFFLVWAALNALILGVIVVAILWVVQRLRSVRALERRIALLEARAREADHKQP
jgi:heme exporter protein D